jgi:hypothetical protein
MDQWSHSNWDPYWNQSSGVYYDINAESVSNVGAIPNSNLYPQMITNADQGTVVSWGADTPAYCASATSNTAGSAPVCNVQVAAATTFGLATTSGGSLASSKTTNLPGQIGPINPILQAQDGTSVGIVFTTTQSSMIAFDSSGNVKWSVPNDYPYIATADGGVVGASGITYDNNGRATGQVGLPIQSWTGNAYTDGPVDQVVAALKNAATSFWSIFGGNRSGTPVAAQTFQVNLHVSKLNGTANVDLAGMIKSAQDIWSKQSNGTIALLWDHSIQNVNPCVILSPPCIRGVDEDDLLDIPSYEANAYWRKTNYFLQKFPNRKGINVVQNATLANGALLWAAK